MRKHEMIILSMITVISLSGWIILLDQHNHRDSTVYDGKEFEDELSIEAYFCPEEDCEKALIERMERSDKIDCAFYDLGLRDVMETMEERDSRIIIDKAYADKVVGDIDVIDDGSSRYMHNKFCIFDNESIMTGSMNPTQNGAYYNDNNIVFVESQRVAENYRHKFDIMFHEGTFKDRDAEPLPYRIVSDIEGDDKVTVLFCPEDDCERNLKDIIGKSESEIRFMTFSFTSSPIAEKIIERGGSGIEVRGIFENWQAHSRWSEFNALNETFPGDMRLSRREGNMHHKTFIVDENKVITGSYNPSENANTNNDENIMIIESEVIADKFLDEFERVWEET